MPCEEGDSANMKGVVAACAIQGREIKPLGCHGKIKWRLGNSGLSMVL